MPIKVTFALLYVITAWGSAFPVTKLVLRELLPVNQVALRFTLASLMFVPVVVVAMRRQGVVRPTGLDVMRLCGLGFLGVTLYQQLQSHAIDLTTASNAGLLMAVTPLHVVILSNLILKEPLTIQKMLGIGLASCGVASVISQGTFVFSFSSSTLAGDLLMVVTSFVFALFSVLGRRMMSRYSPLISIFYATVFGTFCCYPLVLRTGFWTQVVNLSSSGWFAIMFLAACCSVGGYYFWYWGLSQVEASRVAVFQYLQPLVSFFVSALLLGEKVTMATILSAIPIIAGLVLVTHEPHKEKGLSEHEGLSRDS